MQGNDSSSSDNIKPDDYSSFLPKVNFKTEQKYWTRYKESVYPFSQVLRFRVLQVSFQMYLKIIIFVQATKNLFHK